MRRAAFHPEKSNRLKYISGNFRIIRTLGVLSDTHGHVSNTQQAARTFEAFDVEGVVHCGDIGSAEIPRLLDAWPTHYVLGNMDGHSDRLLRAIEETGGIMHGRFGSVRMSERNIAFLHGDDFSRLDAEITRGVWDIICHGHTHQANQHLEGRTLVLNPGALYRSSSPSIAIVDLERLEPTIIPV
ncbi:MAG: YfcE family phosphodiesterase [Planctomycetota bacterium]